MAWAHPLLVVYHGTTANGAASIKANHVQAKFFNARTDFGAGFYVTTNRAQADGWARHQARSISIGGTPVQAAVVEFTIPREQLGGLLALSFIRPEDAHQDFWDLILHCRAGNHHALPGSAQGLYDVVYGPVAANWRFRPYTCYQGYDQISFHTSAGWNLLTLTQVYILP